MSTPTKTISYIVIASIILILCAQAYLVYDYFQTVRLALIRESDTILKEAFRADLNQRNNTYLLSTVNDENENMDLTDDIDVIDFNLSEGSEDEESILNKLDIVMHAYISTFIPINLQKIDSITNQILHERNIASEFVIQLIATEDQTVIASSRELSKSSFFLIPSQPYPLDFENKEALKLILINPFSEIIKRMGLMLLGSIIFSIIALLAFRILFLTLSKQKKLVRFKNEFLSNIAHELKRPVASLTVNLDGLQDPDIFSNTGMRDMMLHNSLNALTEMNGTISMLVGLAREEEGLLVLNKQPVNLVHIIMDLKNRFVSSPVKRVSIHTDFESETIIVQGDSIMLTQCFANLIDNAIKYSDRDAIVNISIRMNKSNVILAFKDQGIGIPADKIEHLFEKYSRVDNHSKVSGFGIGLNYVKTIIEKHGGSISVSSELHVGSTFEVLLPYK
ncbi:MAG TPA: HAMP domain-containing sensor histidine kinase [Paludibacter sp.]|jgi:signal transduction histidine kinase|nr:MAG: Sensor histidine kinase YycG [Bacteroidetes bacterium ADurb.Bin174]HQB28326.1 HAMP domain-containing sensor histidine kinase [Paludibacter sp.]